MLGRYFALTTRRAVYYPEGTSSSTFPRPAQPFHLLTNLSAPRVFLAKNNPQRALFFQKKIATVSRWNPHRWDYGINKLPIFEYLQINSSYVSARMN